MPSRGAKLGTSVLDLDIDDSKFHSKLSGARIAAEKFTDRTAQSLAKAGKAMSGVGESMTRNITLPILAAGGAAAKLGLDFDTTMRQIVGLAKVPRDQIQGVRDDILKMAGDVGRSPQELAEAFYFVASAGFKANEAMEVLEISAKASASGMGQTQDVAKVLGGVLNAYGHENISAAHAADVLTAAVQDGSAEASDFAGVIGTVVPTAAALGVSFDQVTAALSGMTLTGTSADEAATQLTQVFSGLLKPTAQAEDAMKGLGLSSAGLRQELKEKGLLATLRTLEERFQGNDTAAAAVFGNIRALRGITGLLSLDTDQLNGIFADTAGALGTLQQAYDDTDGPQRQIDKDLAKLQATAIKIGEDVLPMVVEVLGDIADKAEDVSKWWGSLDDDTKKLIIQFAAWLAIIGPVLIIVGKLTTAAGGLLKGINFLITRLPFLSAAIKSALGPLGLLIAALEAAGFGADEATKALGVDYVGKIQKAAFATGDFTGAMTDLVDAQNEAGASADDFQGRVAELIDQGMSWTDAINQTKAELAGLPDAIPVEELGARAKAAADMVAAGLHGSLAGTPTAIGNELAAGAPAVAAGADAMLGPMDDAAAAAHKAVLDEIGQLFKDLSALLTKSDFEKQWEDFLAGRNQHFTTSERRLAIEAQLASKDLTAALNSDDPKRVAEAQALVNSLIGEYNTLAPGALAAGELVGPKYGKGIEKNAKLAADEARDTAEKAGLELVQPDEWEGAGLANIGSYEVGQKAHDADVATAARNTAIAAARAMGDQEGHFHRSGFTAAGGFNDGVGDQKGNANKAGGKLNTAAKDGASGSLYTPGYNVGQSWVDGLIAALRVNRTQIAIEAGRSTSGLRGKSPPKEGPLKDIDHWGYNVATAWTDSFADAIRAMNLSGPLAGISAALAGVGTPGLSALGSMVPASASSSAMTSLGGPTAPGNITKQYIINAGGVQRTFAKRDDFISALDDLSTMGGDGRL